jgi:hypothetical protein
MAITEQTPRNVSVAAPGATSFPYDFKILVKGDLLVQVDGVTKVVDVDYTVSGVGQDAGGDIEFIVPLVGGENVMRKRNMKIERLTDFQNLGDLRSPTLNNDQDAPVMLLQQVNDDVQQSFRLPPSVIGVDVELPAPLGLAPLVWNAAANKLENGSTTMTGDMLLRPNLATGAAGKGGDLVAVLQDGVGAVGRTLSSKLNEYISALDFIPASEEAAIRAGTSTLDVRPHLQAAIDRATEQGKELRIPHGVYMLGGTLLLPDRAVIRGAGWSVPFSGANVQAPRGTVLKLLNNANCDVFRQAAKASLYSLNLSGFAIDGNGANQSSNMGPDGTYGMYQFNRNAFFFEALYNAVFDNLFVYNMRGAGWALHGDGAVGMTNVFLQNCQSYNCRTYSIYCEGSVTDLRINGGDFGFGRVANLRLTSSATVVGAVFWTSQCQDPADAATHSTGTGAVINGGIIIAGDNNKIVGCRSEGNAGHGIRCVGNNNKASDCILYFNSSTAATAGLFDGINDLGDDNTWEDMEIRQAPSAAFALRKAIKLEAAHSGTRIRGGDITRVGANAAAVTLPVQGFSFASGDKADFQWASGEVKAYSAAANSIGTVATKVQFRTETVDARNEWSIVNDDFTAAEAGIYRIDTGVNIANATDGNSFILAVYKNGAEYRRIGQQRAGANAAIQICGGLEMKLEAGDVIDIRGTCGTATNTNVGAVLTWVEITQING